MGSCASANVSGVSTELNNHCSGQTGRDITRDCCDRHNNTITHFNVKTEELYCLTCYQDFKRRHTRAESSQVCEITEYVTTIQFKQSEVQTLEKLRNNQYRTEHRLLQISQIQNKLENKRTQILDEIKLYVNTVIDLIKHLEEEICKDANQKILGTVNEMKNYQNALQTQLRTLSTLKNEIENNSDYNAARLTAVVKCKTFLKQNASRRDEIKDCDPTLKLNKYISLNEITGKGKGPQKVCLGYILCENKKSSISYDALSDISEYASDDSVYTKRSTTQQTCSTSGANSSQRYTDESSVPGTLTAGENATHNTYNTEGKVKPNIPLDMDTVSPVKTNEEEAVNIRDKGKEFVHDTADEIERPYTNAINLNPAEETFDKSLQRLQFRRDNVISRNVPRRVSYSGTPSRKTPTPRRSSQSIVSPGNITSPYFISPRPAQRKESMERRIAAKYREIKLPRDEKISNVTDTVQIGDGSIVLCDQKNEKLLLLDNNLQIRGQVKLRGHPHNVTNVPDGTRRIAVTIPDENVIKLVQVVDDTFDETIEVIKLQSKPKCRGIDYVDGNLIYTSRNDVAVLRKDDVTRTWKFKYAFREPVSLLADCRNDVIYVSCLGSKSFGEVVKMHYRDEQIDFVISCNEIKHPVCSTIDEEGYIYICDIDPPSIHQVSPDGKYCRRLLSASQGKFQHVSFIKGTDLFIATENDSDTVHIYEMT